jgi:hypothetical protein
MVSLEGLTEDELKQLKASFATLAEPTQQAAAAVARLEKEALADPPEPAA